MAAVAELANDVGSQCGLPGSVYASGILLPGWP